MAGFAEIGATGTREVVHRMRPLDPRLLRASSAVRAYLAVTVGCGIGLTALIVGQAWLIAHIIAEVTDGAAPGGLSWAIGAVAGVALARTALAYGGEVAALRSAARAKSQLRRRLVEHVAHGPADPTTRNAGELATLATRGLDALDDYFARYLPQLVLSAMVPLTVAVVIARSDWISGLVVVFTLPLIPVFMALIGWRTQAHSRKQWRLLNRLGGHFLDVVQGLPTLAVFRRAKAQAATIRRISDEHRAATMSTLRVAFLSAFALELIATLSVAVVAVEIGLRLMYGDIGYETALLVLILAPEAYLPLREVGARFHASMEGVAAAEQVFTILEERGTAKLNPDKEDLTDARHRRIYASSDISALSDAKKGADVASSATSVREVRLVGVGLSYPEREKPVLSDVSLTLRPGEPLLLTGPSGGGKSSLLKLLLRFVEPTAGEITITTADGIERPLHDLDLAWWRKQIAWLPQHPYLFDETVTDNIRLGSPDSDVADVRRAAELAEAHDLITALPHGYETRLGERGTRLSAGQRQRIALARVFLRDAPLVLLDEPTAHLDVDNARAVRDGVGRLLVGRMGIVVAHDEHWATITDRTVPLGTGNSATPLTEVAR